MWHLMMQAELDFVTPPWPKISAAAKDCVRQLLTVQAQSRPSASELLQVSMSISVVVYVPGMSSCAAAMVAFTASFLPATWPQELPVRSHMQATVVAISCACHGTG